MKYKNYKLKDIFNVTNSKGINANQISFGGEHPYVTRTEKNNGIIGYINEDITKLNPANTISFGQDTWMFFYQEKPYFTGNRIKVLSLKSHALTKNIAMFLIPYLNKMFSNLSWGTNANEVNFSDRIISLPVKATYIPDFAAMSTIGGGIDMNNIDTSSWKNFRLDEILQRVDVMKIPLKKGDCSTSPTSEYSIPARTATTNNQGLSCYVPASVCTILKNKISVSANGDFCAFWHDSDFTILQDSYALEGKGFELTESVALFLISLMTHCFAQKYNWNNKSGWEKLRNEIIPLPVTEKEEIDWDYMQERIEELEQERIEELEQYLIATGLNDYELTEEDKEILATKLTDGGVSRSTTSGSGYWKEARMFRVGDLFTVEGTKSLDAGALEFRDTGVNFVGRTDENNGVQGKIDRQVFEPNDAKTMTATVIGNYKYVKYQEEPYYCSQNVNKLTPVFLTNKLLGLYFRNIIQKFVSLYDGQQSGYKLDELRDYTFILPIRIDSNNTPVVDQDHTYHPDGYIPDWDFMEKYIRAIEKVVIADVVKYKDSVLENTKKVAKSA